MSAWQLEEHRLAGSPGASGEAAGPSATATAGSALCATILSAPTSTASFRLSPPASSVASGLPGARGAGFTRATWSTFLVSASWSTPLPRYLPMTATNCWGRRPHWSTISTAEASTSTDPSPRPSTVVFGAITVQPRRVPLYATTTRSYSVEFVLVQVGTPHVLKITHHSFVRAGWQVL